VTDQTPDHVPCRHCGQPISWDEICWTHDEHGFADCGLVLSSGTRIGPYMTVDPKLTIDPKYKDKRAEPVGEWH
jgi:hypothetical protein